MDNPHDIVTPRAPSATPATLAAPPAAQAVPPAAAATGSPEAEKPGVVEDVLIESVSIDGMCGVY